MRRPRLPAAVLAGLLVVATPALAQSVQPVVFAKGASSKVVTGTIVGDAYIDYVVNAANGQTLSVRLARQAGSPYFNVTAPGADYAVHIGSAAGDDYAGPVTVAGNQVIRVYQMRATGRRGETARYTLTVGVSGRPAKPAPVTSGGDRLVPGTRYHATADVPCVTSTNGPAGPCKAGVIRRGGGNATVELETPDGGQRRIHFTGGKASGSDGGPVDVSRSGDLSIIRIGTVETYRIPDAFVFGG